MFYQNFEMIDALSKSKQYKPLVIEGVVVEMPQRAGVLRQRVAAAFRWVADAVEPRPLPAQTAAYGPAG